LSEPRAEEAQSQGTSKAATARISRLHTRRRIADIIAVAPLAAEGRAQGKEGHRRRKEPRLRIWNAGATLFIDRDVLVMAELRGVQGGQELVGHPSGELHGLKQEAQLSVVVKSSGSLSEGNLALELGAFGKDQALIRRK
jgi:hypothetical protein